ncbi:MAG: outer membrane protein [Methylocystis sp.]|uniref:outer membrane protein n=1 Tax=Methylocystis sp. TaxID=1911079 RepID=UPI003DA33A38
MKKITVSVAMLALSAGVALAADLPSRKAAPILPPPPPPPPMWTGFYAGLNLGGGWSSSTINSSGMTGYVSPATGNYFILPGNTQGGSNAGGVVGGGQIGYNYQFGSNIVVGIETDFQGTSMSTGGMANHILYPDPDSNGFLIPLAPGGNRGVALNWFGTLRGRAGFLITPTLLVYGTGGFAYGQVSGGPFNGSNVRTGWTAGGGVEWMFMQNWSAKAEYLYTDLQTNTSSGVFGFSPGYHHHPQFNTVRAGVNYHFNFGGAGAPVLAKY